MKNFDEIERNYIKFLLEERENFLLADKKILIDYEEIMYIKMIALKLK